MDLILLKDQRDSEFSDFLHISSIEKLRKQLELGTFRGIVFHAIVRILSCLSVLLFGLIVLFLLILF